MNIPKFEIRWLVGRMHVSTPDAEIKAKIRNRITPGENGWTEAKIVEAEEYAVACMNKNRQLMRDFRL